MEENKKTIFMTIGRGMTARDLLLNDFAKILGSKYRVVILTPGYLDKEFLEKFSSFIIEPLYQRPLSPVKRRIEGIFIALHKSLIYNPTVDIRSRYDFLSVHSPVKFKNFRYFIQKYIFGKFFQRNLIRNFLKKLDALIFPCRLYDKMIKRYNPELVFITSIADDNETALLRNCKHLGIKSVAMPKSWDESSNYGYREKTDKIIVWSEYIKEEILKFQAYKESQIAVIGIPQFDYYKNIKLPSHEEFCGKFGLDPSKKIIFYGSEGPFSGKDHIAPFLKKKIEGGILENHQILIRPHFSYKSDEERFLDSIDNKIVFMDRFHRPSDFKDRTELSLEPVINLMCEIKYSDAAIIGPSTLFLDALANGKNAILYSFDERENTPLGESIKRFYEALWFKEILKLGAFALARNKEELLEKIKAIEENPKINESERNLMIERFCYKIDGQSGRRLFEVLDKSLSEK